jgi:hypothetical protein
MFTAILRASFAEQLSCGAAARLILEIDTGECLFVVVTHDKAGGKR